MSLVQRLSEAYRYRAGWPAIKIPTLPSTSSVLFVIAISIMAFFLGLFPILLPWWLILVFVGFLTSLVLPVRYPFAGLVLTIFFVFNVIPERFFPEIPFLGGKLKIYDVMWMYLAMIQAAGVLMHRRSIRQALGPAFWPLVYVLTCVAISAAYGRLFLHNLNAITEARNHLGWLALPITVLCVDTPQKLKYLLRAIVFASIVLAIYLLLQSFFQIQITGGRVEALDLHANSDITRSTAGGGAYLIALSLIYCLLMTQARQMPWWLAMPICLVLAAGLSVTFGRGVWIATAIGLILASILYRGLLGGFLTALVGAIVLAAILLGMSVVKPRLVEAVVDRATGVGQEIRTGGSFHDRIIEDTAALEMIRRRPLLGVGAGGAYKQVVSSAGSFDIEAMYIHNSYLYFPVKMGILATGIPFAFMLAFASMYRRWFRGLATSDRVLPATAAGAFVVPMITSFTQPEWAAMQGIVAISLLFAIGWLAKRTIKDSAGPARTAPPPPWSRSAAAPQTLAPAPGASRRERSTFR